MVRSSSSKSSILSQGQELLNKLLSVDPLSWAVIAVVVVYIAVARPSNTPSVFKNSLFRLAVFAFVAVVFIVEGPMIGTMFALAMLLPVVYSSMQTPLEGFYEDENEANGGADDSFDDEAVDDEEIDEDDDEEGDQDVNKHHQRRDKQKEKHERDRERTRKQERK
jgi:hypothetical protein